MDAKTYLLEELAREQQHLNESAAMINALPDGLDVSRAQLDSSGGVILVIPYDRSLMARIRKVMGPKWHLRFVDSVKENGSQMRFYTQDKRGSLLHTLSIHLHTDLPGATCRRVQVGEKVTPVYEVHCG